MLNTWQIWIILEAEIPAIIQLLNCQLFLPVDEYGHHLAANSNTTPVNRNHVNFAAEDPFAPGYTSKENLPK